MSRNLPVKQEAAPPPEGANLPDLLPGTVFSSVAKFRHIQTLAASLATSTMVPKHFQGMQNVGNIVIAIDLADRLNVHPFMLSDMFHRIGNLPLAS